MIKKKIEQLQKTSKKIEVTNTNTNEVTIYPSIGAAARALGYPLCQCGGQIYYVNPLRQLYAK
jgi:hypothetical protein